MSDRQDYGQGGEARMFRAEERLRQRSSTETGAFSRNFRVRHAELAEQV